MSRHLNVFGQNRPFYIKISVFPCAHGPFYQSQAFAAYLNAGDTPGMYAAADIDIMGIRGQHGAMSMAGDEGSVVEIRPFAQFPLGALLGGVIFGGAGGIQNAYLLQRLPEVPD